VTGQREKGGGKGTKKSVNFRKKKSKLNLQKMKGSVRTNRLGKRIRRGGTYRGLWSREPVFYSEKGVKGKVLEIAR